MHSAALRSDASQNKAEAVDADRLSARNLCCRTARPFMRRIVQAGWRGPMDFPSIAEQTDRSYISPGHLPEPEVVQRLVSEAHRRFKSNSDGHNSQVYPALARVPRELFGVCVVGPSGRVYEAGDTEHKFSIMSVSKPFVFALVWETIGPGGARGGFGAPARGCPFNS